MNLSAEKLTIELMASNDNSNAHSINGQSGTFGGHTGGNGTSCDMGPTNQLKLYGSFGDQRTNKFVNFAAMIAMGMDKNTGCQFCCEIHPTISPSSLNSILV